MKPIWLESYPPGVPAQVDADVYTSLVDMFERSVARYSNKIAYGQMNTSLSYADVEQKSRAFAAFLCGEFGLEKGASVALMMPNILQYPIALFGVLRAGCVVVNCSPLYTARELAQQLRDSNARAIVIMENFAHILDEALPQTRVEHVIVTRLGDMMGLFKGALVNFVISHVKRLVPRWRIGGAVMFKAALEKGAALTWQSPTIAPGDTAFLQYTGGTTGTPKGAILTHRNLVANILQHHAYVQAALQDGKDVVLTAIPMAHIYGLMINCLLPVKIGAMNVLVVDARDIPSVVAAFAQHRVTCFAAVNRLFAALIENEDFARIDFSELRITASGGSPLQERVAMKWRRITGKNVLEAYGLTEASPVVTCNPVTMEHFNGTCGLPVPSTEISIRDDKGVELGVGEAGELCVRGPQVMKGYWNRPEETAGVMMSDGFLRTGDIATIDEEGFVRIVDRKKDMINVSGLKVYPSELEEVIGKHPGVADVAAIGVPDERSGEAVKIFVVKAAATLDAAELRAYCQRNLAAYKIPRFIEFTDTLPKTMLGKTIRRALREQAPSRGASE